MRHSLGSALIVNALVATLVLGTTACPDPEGKKTVSADPQVQVAYEMARHALADIRRNKAREHNVYADCRAVELLTDKRLAKLSDPAVKKLLKEIHTVCRKAAPY